MFCSGNIDDDPIYQDKFIVFSNKTASEKRSSKEFIKEETCSLFYEG